MAPFGRQHPTKQKGPGGVGTGRKKKLFIRRGSALIGLWAPSLGKDAACSCVSAASRDSLDAIPIRSLYIFERLSTFQFGCLVIWRFRRENGLNIWVVICIIVKSVDNSKWKKKVSHRCHRTRMVANRKYRHVAQSSETVEMFKRKWNSWKSVDFRAHRPLDFPETQFQLESAGCAINQSNGDFDFVSILNN